MEAKIKDNKVILKYAKKTIELDETDLEILFSETETMPFFENMPLQYRNTKDDIRQERYKWLKAEISIARTLEIAERIKEEENDGDNERGI